MKICTRCKLAKFLDSEFYGFADGRHQSWCKDCVKEQYLLRKTNLDDVMLRCCRRCKISHLRKYFSGRTNICDYCAKAGHKNIYHSLSKEERTRKNRIESLWKMYKLTPEGFEELSVLGCAICGTMVNLCVDHDHSCCPGKYTCGYCVRGVLCSSHNRGEGAFKSIEEIERLLAYRLKFEKLGAS